MQGGSIGKEQVQLEKQSEIIERSTSTTNRTQGGQALGCSKIGHGITVTEPNEHLGQYVDNA